MSKRGKFIVNLLEKLDLSPNPYGESLSFTYTSFIKSLILSDSR